MFQKIFKFLASLKLAVILLISLSAILSVATWLEAKYDAKTAAHMVYGSWWFYLFLFMLGVNVLAAALIRYPWKRHQTGFVIVHLGIIVILVGSFITWLWGLEGSMQLAEGQQASTVQLDQSQLAMQTLKPGANGFERGAMHAVPIDLRWSPPTEAKPRRIALADGIVAVVDRYIHSAQPVEAYKPAPEGAADATPAVHVTLTAGKGAPMPEGTVMADQWLALDQPDHAEVRMGPAAMRLVAATSQADLDRILAGPRTDKLDVTDGVLTVEVQGRSIPVAVAGNHGREVALEGTPYRLRIDRFHPFAVVGKDNKLTSRSDERQNPAVELTVLDEKGEAEKQVLFAKFPEFTTAHSRKRPAKLKIAYAMEEAPGAANAIVFVVGPDGKLHVRIDTSGGKSHVDPVEMGKPTATGWRMNFQYTVNDFTPRAQAFHEYKEFKAARGMMGGGGFPPAIHLTVEGVDEPGPYWLGQGDALTLPRAKGQEAIQLAYNLKSIDIGFSVKLLDFEVGFDPGTRNPATYTSKVQVDDTKRQQQFDATITMNEPMIHNGLTFFQASFSQGEGSETSIFQVAHDPGVPVKYAGSILLCIGLAAYVFARQPRNRSQSGGPSSAKKPGKAGRPKGHAVQEVS